MNQPQRILQIEIKTMDNPGFESSQLNSITVYENGSSYYLALDLSLIRAVIIEAVKTIISLGNNYRHPLYFDVQIVTANEMDADVALIEESDRPVRKRRKRTN